MSSKILVPLFLLFAFFLMVWGLTGDAPFAAEGDEIYCVGPALEMLRRNELNPHWFAHPASTTIYPLYVYYQYLNAAVFHGGLASSDICTEDLIFDNIWLLCYLPRFMNVAFILGCLALLYRIGARLFGTTAGLLALPFFLLSPLLLDFVQVIRSEAPALFFSLLAIYLSLKLYRMPTLPLHILVGITIGLGVSSRYPMLALVVLFLPVDFVLAFKERKVGTGLKYLAYGAAGLAATIVTFAVTTPFFFLDFKTFLHDMVVERAAHGLGCGGLSILGNFQYYIAEAIPGHFCGVQTLLAFVGMLITLLRRQYDAILLIGYFLATLAGTCLHPFHTDKWIIPILPILSVFAAYSMALLLTTIKLRLAKFVGHRAASLSSAALALISVIYLEWKPCLACCLHNTAKIVTSTEPQFYKWIFENVPAGTKICVLGGVWDGGHRDRFQTKDFLVDPSFFDTECAGKYVSPFELYKQGYTYFICSDGHYPLYLEQPDLYPRESRFFKEFFENSTLVKEVAPRELIANGSFHLLQRGQTFRLYRFTPKAEKP